MIQKVKQVLDYMFTAAGKHQLAQTMTRGSKTRLVQTISCCGESCHQQFCGSVVILSVSCHQVKRKPALTVASALQQDLDHTYQPAQQSRRQLYPRSPHPSRLFPPPWLLCVSWLEERVCRSYCRYHHPPCWPSCQGGLYYQYQIDAKAMKEHLV